MRKFNVTQKMQQDYMLIKHSTSCSDTDRKSFVDEILIESRVFALDTREWKKYDENDVCLLAKCLRFIWFCIEWFNKWTNPHRAETEKLTGTREEIVCWVTCYHRGTVFRISGRVLYVHHGHMYMYVHMCKLNEYLEPFNVCLCNVVYEL